jgi:hypothetical protein
VLCQFCMQENGSSVGRKVSADGRKVCRKRFPHRQQCACRCMSKRKMMDCSRQTLRRIMRRIRLRLDFVSAFWPFRECQNPFPEQVVLSALNPQTPSLPSLSTWGSKSGLTHSHRSVHVNKCYSFRVITLQDLDWLSTTNQQLKTVFSAWKRRL